MLGYHHIHADTWAKNHYMNFTWAEISYMTITWNKKTLHVLHVKLHNQPILHDFYMLFQYITWQLHVFLHDITWILHEYFFIFPFLSNVTPSFCFLAGTQSACWMFTRKFALNPLHGWLLPFILYWDKNPCGMNEGGIPPSLDSEDRQSDGCKVATYAWGNSSAHGWGKGEKGARGGQEAGPDRTGSGRSPFHRRTRSVPAGSDEASTHSWSLRARPPEPPEGRSRLPAAVILGLERPQQLFIKPPH